MRIRWQFRLAALVVIGAAVSWAQDSNVIDFRTWLQQQPPRAPDAADVAQQARQAVRDRITALRQARGKTQAFTRNGQWKSDRRRDTQSWFVQAQHNTDDGTLTGRLGVVGSRSLSGGTINGHIDSTSVSGTITDPSTELRAGSHGAQLATFTGSIRGQRMNGTYQTADGDFGDWSYNDGIEPRGIESLGHRAIDGIDQPQADTAAMQQPQASDAVAEVGVDAAVQTTDSGSD